MNLWVFWLAWPSTIRFFSFSFYSFVWEINISFNHKKGIWQSSSNAAKFQLSYKSWYFGNHCCWPDMSLKITKGGRARSATKIYLIIMTQDLKQEFLVIAELWLEFSSTSLLYLNPSIMRNLFMLYQISGITPLHWVHLS